jgi:hypothetical protein
MRGVILAIAVIGIWLLLQGSSGAHCDTLDGPVVASAEVALQKADIAPVLKWVKKEDEKELMDLFKKTLSVRKQGKEAEELADRYFFETLVRLHRAGEGAPYTGLKAAGAVEPAVAAADRALESGSADSLVAMVNDAAAKGIRERFEHTTEAKKRSDESIEAGREFVEAYVEFTHYVERLHKDALATSGHAEEPRTGGAEEHHH